MNTEESEEEGGGAIFEIIESRSDAFSSKRGGELLYGESLKGMNYKEESQ